MPELNSIEALILSLAVGGVAFVYSSVGHGGATGYLALAALLGLAPAVSRPGALWMNCCVASIAFWRFKQAGCFDSKVFWPLALASIPCAWAGSLWNLHGRAYAIVLGLGLLAAGWFLGWGRRDDSLETVRRIRWPLALAAGGLLGFLAGLTGIGGGVFLTPLLVFLHWAPAKVAGGISALFILVNSMAGLAGLGARALIWDPAFLGVVALGILGAFLGTHWGVNRWHPATFRRVLALVVWIAAGKLLVTGT